jgi:hypothetical protein
MRIKIILALLTFVSFMSCRTKKMPASSEVTAVEIVDLIRERQLQYRDWYAKGSISFDSPDIGISGSFTARIRKDSAIVLSFRKLGMEWAKILVDPQKYTLLNRWDRTSDTGFLSEYRNIIPFQAEYADVENLLSGNVLLPQEENSNLHLKGDNYILQFSREGYDFEYSLNKSDLFIREASVRQKDKLLAIMTWDNFQTVQGAASQLPFDRTVKIFSDEEAPTLIEIRVNKVDIDDQGTIHFSIPDDYERL